MTAWSLRALVDPVSVEEFFSTYFESQRLLVQRNRPGYFSGLLTLDDIDRILTTEESKRGEVSVVDAARKIKRAEYIYGDDTIRVDQVFRLYDSGGTIILNHLHTRHQPLAKLCAALELEFSAGFQTNIYVTPAAAQGFHPHFDTHDVLVLQITGSKQWQLYDTPLALTLKGHGDYARQDDPGKVTEEIDLEEGDTLYIPRGLVHKAVSTDETSLHITVGIMSWTWFDVLLEAVESLAASDQEVRAALPHTFAGPHYDREGFHRTFRELAGRLANVVDPEAVRERFAERLIDRRSPFLRHQLDALAKIDRLGPDSVVGCRPFLAHLIDEDEQTIRLRFHRHETSFPSHASAALRHALDSERFRIRDLPGGLDDDGKLVLVRRLVREGLLHPLD